MIDLKDVTFIIPVRIESNDRYSNADIVLNYLCRNFTTNIIIMEHDTDPKIPAILSNVQKGNTEIKYHFIKNGGNEPIFHRTKFLNEMLNMVTTPVVVNYDVDILLDPKTYVKCRDLILNGKDLVYPYFLGNSQYQINYNGRGKISKNYDLSSLEYNDYKMTRSEFGHCQFFNTESYIKGGMENEGFISYAPEDQERGYRFKKMGYNVMWSDDFVYHIEHTRGINSSGHNPMMENNNKLFQFIKDMSLEDLVRYYKNIDYLKKYKKI